MHGAMDYAKLLKRLFHGGDLDLRARRKRYTAPAVGRRTWMHIRARVALQWRVELTQQENVKYTRRNGMC